MPLVCALVPATPGRGHQALLLRAWAGAEAVQRPRRQQREPQRVGRAGPGDRSIAAAFPKAAAGPAPPQLPRPLCTRDETGHPGKRLRRKPRLQPEPSAEPRAAQGLWPPRSDQNGRQQLSCARCFGRLQPPGSRGIEPERPRGRPERAGWHPWGTAEPPPAAPRARELGAREGA